MINKLLLAGAIVVGSMAVAPQSADAGGCHYGTPYRYGHVHRHRAYAYRAPVHSHRIYGAYRPAVYPYAVPVYRSYPVYRGGYIGPRVGVGYGSYGVYGRSGVSIGIGF